MADYIQFIEIICDDLEIEKPLVDCILQHNWQNISLLIIFLSTVPERFRLILCFQSHMS